MSFTEQSRRLLPTADQKMSANAYLTMTALAGVIGWSPTVYVLHFMGNTPSGVVGVDVVGPWLQTVGQYSWPLMAMWAGASVLLVLVGFLRVERAALLSAPQLLWTAGIVVSLGVNAYAVWAKSALLVWAPWLVLFTVGYLATGLLVARGGVYLGAGVVTLLVTALATFNHFTGNGALMVAPDAPQLAGAVLFPIPYVYVVIAVLHVVPVAIDAARGGRQMTDQGIPKVKAERLADDGGSGGVVPD